MIAIKLQDNLYNIPTSIKDITLGKLIEFRNLDLNNQLDIVHWILGKKVEFKLTDTIENEIANVIALSNDAINQMYGFFKDDNLKHETPKTIHVLGLDIDFKNDLIDNLPYWPYERAKNIFNKMVDKKISDPTDFYPEVLAHYLFSLITKEVYNEKKADDFIEIVNDIPMAEAIQAGNFFFRLHKKRLKLKR